MTSAVARIKYIKYQCAGCGAEDTYKLYPLMIPVAFDCWRCGAGRGKDPQAMLETRSGMLRVEDDGGAAVPEPAPVA